MRSRLLLWGLIFLALFGCLESQEQNTPTAYPTPFAPNQQINTTNPAPTQQIQSIQGSAPQGYSQYVDYTHHFSFYYPEHWGSITSIVQNSTIGGVSGENTTVFLGDNVTNTSINIQYIQNGSIYVDYCVQALQECEQQFLDGIEQAFPYGTHLLNYGVVNLDNRDAFFMEYNTDATQIPYTMNGVSGTITNPPAYHKQVFIGNGDDAYIISLSGPESYQQNQAIFDNILSTFRFTN